MLLDTYERTTNTACLTMFSNVFKGFIADHGATWEQNEFNDDIMWMVIACARAHQLTGNPVYRDTARTNFDLCYARAWSTNLGGGWWWKTSNLSKNACVNGPISTSWPRYERNTRGSSPYTQLPIATVTGRYPARNSVTGFVLYQISQDNNVAQSTLQKCATIEAALNDGEQPPGTPGQPEQIPS